MIKIFYIAMKIRELLDNFLAYKAKIQDFIIINTEKNGVKRVIAKTKRKRLTAYGKKKTKYTTKMAILKIGKKRNLRGSQKEWDES